MPIKTASSSTSLRCPTAKPYHCLRGAKTTLELRSRAAPIIHGERRGPEAADAKDGTDLKVSAYKTNADAAQFSISSLGEV